MIDLDRARKAFKDIFNRNETDRWLYGLAGKAPAGAPIFDVPGRANFIFVRIRNASGAQTTTPARNDAGVPHSYDLPVRMRYEGKTLVIDGVARRDDLATVPASPPSGVPPHIHDDRYYTEVEHIATSAGAADAGKPIVLDAAGHVDASMINDADIGVGALINAATGKTPVVDADEFGIADSAASFVLKKLTWANLKATLVSTALTWLANVTIASTATAGSALRVIRNLTSTSTDSPVVDIVQDHASDDQAALRVQQDGTGDIAQFFDGATKIVYIPDGGNGMTVGAGSGQAFLKVDGGAGVARQVGFYTAGSLRFLFQVTATAESGANAGSNWALLARDDAGGVLSAPIVLERATGNLLIGALDALAFAAARLQVLQPTLGGEVFRLTSSSAGSNPLERVHQNRITTTNATPATLHTVAITASFTYMIEAVVIARRTGGTAGTADDGAAYVLRSAYTTKAGVVTLMTGGPMEAISSEDVAGWDAALVISGTNVIVQVTGALDTNITWNATVRVWHVGS